MDSNVCFATGEAVVSTESEFFSMKSFVACVIRCEAMISAELMTSIATSVAGDGRGIEFCRWAGISQSI